MNDGDDRLLSVLEVAELLQVKPKTIYAWVSRKSIPFRKVGSLVRFHRGELIDWTRLMGNQVGQQARRISLTMVK